MERVFLVQDLVQCHDGGTGDGGSTGNGGSAGNGIGAGTGFGSVSAGGSAASGKPGSAGSLPKTADSGAVGAAAVLAMGAVACGAYGYKIAQDQKDAEL